MSLYAFYLASAAGSWWTVIPRVTWASCIMKLVQIAEPTSCACCHIVRALWTEVTRCTTRSTRLSFFVSTRTIKSSTACVGRFFISIISTIVTRVTRQTVQRGIPLDFGIVSAWFTRLVVRSGCPFRTVVTLWTEIADICGGVGIAVETHWTLLATGLAFLILIATSRTPC